MMGLVAETASTATRIEWRNLPESWQAFVAFGAVLALAAYVVWSYRREADTLGPGVRALLVGLRLATIAALVVLLFDPVRTDYRTLRRYPTVAVMADLSQSMARQDNWSDDAVAKPIADALKMSLDEFRAARLSRVQIVQRLLSAEQALPQALRSKANVRVMTFGGQIDTAGTLPSIDEANAEKEQQNEASENETESPPQNDPFQSLVAQVSQWQAEGASTDLSGAIQAALGVNQLRALYLISDGQHTGSSQPVELAQRAAELGVPVYAIGVGDPARPRNAAVRDAAVLAKARPNEPFSIDTVVTASEMAGSSLQLELYRIAMDEDRTASEPERVDSKEISVLDQAWLSRERFTQRVENPGRYRYEVRIAPIDGELDVADNGQETSMVEITNEKIRLLLISGGPTWEYQNLRKLFERDPGILVSCWLQSLAPERSQEGNDRISVLPRSFEDLSRYNAILMIDPNPDEFDEAWVEALTKFVERKAGGLLFMAGPKYTSDFLTLPRTTNVKQLLPVRLESAADASLSTLLQVSSGVPAIDVVDANLDHPVMSFTADRATNQRIWTAMPGTYWSFPAIAAKPTAKTLVEHQDATLSLDGESRRPLLVAGRYGAGNTLYIGFPGTWRWRSVGVQAEYYDRFWIQAVRYLTDTRSIQGLKRGTVDPDREFYELGDRVELAAQLLGPTFEPLDLPEVSGTLKVDEGAPLPITFRQVEGQPGQYVTTIRARTVGRYEIAVDLADVTDPSLLEPARFRVEAPSAETKATWLNEPLLREICDASGGAYYRVDQLEEAVASLSTGFETVEWREPPKPVWDLTGTTRTLMFLLPVLLLAVEWGVRKWAKLL